MPPILPAILAGHGIREQNEDWARLLRSNWETLARTPYRDFFIASHRGWDDPETWSAQARFDADIALHERTPAELAALDLLELGCGVGRLAQVIAPRVRSYTGFDVAPSMVGGGAAPARRIEGRALLPRRRCACPPTRPTIAATASPSPWRSSSIARASQSALVADVCSLLAPGASSASSCGPTRATRPASRPSPGAAHRGPAAYRGWPARRASPTPCARSIRSSRTATTWATTCSATGEVVPFLRAAFPAGLPRVLRFDPQHIYVDLRVP